MSDIIYMFVCIQVGRFVSSLNFVFDKLNVERSVFDIHYALIFVFFEKHFSSNAIDG
jgi:hypothetical protein